MRHRISFNYLWSIPWGRNASGLVGEILGGWQLAGIYSAQTGTPFPVFEDLGSFNDQCSQSQTNSCFPVVTGPLPGQQHESTFAGPNRPVLYDLGNSLESLDQFCGGNPASGIAGDPVCAQTDYFFRSGTPFLRRNSHFRAPGYWNFDASLLKNFKLPREGMALQFRAEFFNLFNHSNLFLYPLTTDTAGYQQARGGGVAPEYVPGASYYDISKSRSLDRFNVDCGQISQNENISEWVRPGCWHVLTFHAIGDERDGWEPITVDQFSANMADLARYRDSGAVEVLTFARAAERLISRGVYRYYRGSQPHVSGRYNTVVTWLKSRILPLLTA